MCWPEEGRVVGACDQAGLQAAAVLIAELG